MPVCVKVPETVKLEILVVVLVEIENCPSTVIGLALAGLNDPAVTCTFPLAPTCRTGMVRVPEEENLSKPVTVVVREAPERVALLVPEKSIVAPLEMEVVPVTVVVPPVAEKVPLKIFAFATLTVPVLVEVIPVPLSI